MANTRDRDDDGYTGKCTAKFKDVASYPTSSSFPKDGKGPSQRLSREEPISQ